MSRLLLPPQGDVYVPRAGPSGSVYLGQVHRAVPLGQWFPPALMVPTSRFRGTMFTGCSTDEVDQFRPPQCLTNNFTR